MKPLSWKSTKVTGLAKPKGWPEPSRKLGF